MPPPHGDPGGAPRWRPQLTVHSRTPVVEAENWWKTWQRSCGGDTASETLMEMETVASRGRSYLLFHVAVETQEAELLIGRVPGQDGAEEQVQELDGFAARHENDHLVALRELRVAGGQVSMATRCREAAVAM